MFEKNDYVIYKKDVCIVKGIKDNKTANNKCYILNPIDDHSLTINVPITNELGHIRPIISEEEVMKIIKEIPSILPIDNINDKMIETEYKKLLNSGTHQDLIKIIKTTYLRNDARLQNKKKPGEKDNIYFKKAERLLYNEFMIAINLNFEETRQYVINKVSETTN